MIKSDHPRTETSSVTADSPRRRASANEARPRSEFRSNVTAEQNRRGPWQLPVPCSKPTGLKYVQEDGVSHINVYSRGATELGKQLSHFWKKPFVHPFYGKFNSMEGFWHYIKAEAPDDQLRTLHGPEAKFYGAALPRGRLYDSFYDVIIEANFHKIVQNAELAQMVVDSTLPFDHYFLLPPGPVFVRKPGFEWLVEGLEKIRQELKYAQQAQLTPAWPSPLYEAHLS